MNLQRFEPFSLINVLNRDLDRFAGRTSSGPVADWIPAVDILEQKDGFVIRADLPGVSAEDIDVSMEDGLLSISGERSRLADAEFDGVRRFERAAGKFVRRFTLPDNVDADGIAARSADGILEITIPKQPEVDTTRRIAVEAA